ncbi:MAG: FHA domain-containing protein [Chloroflexota bacterium]
MSDATAKLIRLIPSGANEEIDLIHDVTTLGRAATCQVVIAGEFASRRHAQIIRRDEMYWLRDLGSKNGTRLNSAPVRTEMRLVDGAEIKIGDAAFRFYDAAATSTFTGVDIEATEPGQQHLSADGLRVIEAAREIWLNNQKLDPPLSPKQFDLLLYLWQRKGQAVSKDEIALAVWPEAASDAVYNYQIDKMVSRLRERLGKEQIETVWGYGFKLRIKN